MLQKQITTFENVWEKPVCNTCQCEIEDSPSRVLSISDKSGNPIVLHYHYFFPCWDLSLLCQEYPDFEIVSAGYVCGSEILKNSKQLRNLKQNLDLWD